MRPIQGKYLMEKDMEKGYRYGMMEPNMKEVGKMINLMDMELFIIQMVMYIKDIGKIIELMVKEYI